MIPILSGKIASSFIAYGIIAEEDQEVYSYGFEILLATIMNFIGICVLMVIAGTIWETAFFLLAFLPLRQLAGGYHAKSHLRCFLILMVTYAIFLLLIKNFPHPYIDIAVAVFLLTSVIIVYLLAPVPDINKPLSQGEVKKFKKKSRTAIMIYMIAIVVLFIFVPNKGLAFSLTLGVFSVSLSLIAGVIKHYWSSFLAARQD